MTESVSLLPQQQCQFKRTAHIVFVVGHCRSGCCLFVSGGGGGQGGDVRACESADFRAAAAECCPRAVVADGDVCSAGVLMCAVNASVYRKQLKLS